jgi:hypothetical protein
MKDTECISAAYANTIQGLYEIMLKSYAAAGGSKQVESKANEAFKAGILLARRVRSEAENLSK